MYNACSAKLIWIVVNSNSVFNLMSATYANVSIF